MAYDICDEDRAIVCQFASLSFDEKSRVETLCIAFTKECEYVDTFCPHYEFYLDCETGCAAKAREIENQDADGESYPVMIGPVDEIPLLKYFADCIWETQSIEYICLKLIHKPSNQLYQFLDN